MTWDDAVLLALVLSVHHPGGTAARTSPRWAEGSATARARLAPPGEPSSERGSLVPPGYASGLRE